MDEYVSIGYTEKPHGLKGDIKININEAYWDDLEYLETFFIKVKGKPTPYFLDELREGNAIIAKFEDVDSRDAAQVISSCEILVRTTDLELIPVANGSNDLTPLRTLLEYGLCVGYEMHDATLGSIGKVKEVVEYPSQELALIDYDGREVMIPLNPFIVQTIDHKARTLAVSLPEGLLEL